MVKAQAGSSRTTRRPSRGEAGASVEAARPTRTSARWVDRAPAPTARARRARRGGADGESVRRRGGVLRAARRAAAAGSRLRGPALGGRRPARLRRPSRRVVGRRAAARARHRAPRAARPPARLGRREAERRDARADTARRPRGGVGHRTAVLDQSGPARGDPAGPAGARRRQSALRRAVRAHSTSERGTCRGLPLPETVQGIIAARLDGLAPDEKQLVQDAAVFGKVFWLGAAAALAGVEPESVGAAAPRARAQGVRPP